MHVPGASEPVLALGLAANATNVSAQRLYQPHGMFSVILVRIETQHRHLVGRFSILTLGSQPAHAG